MQYNGTHSCWFVYNKANFALGLAWWCTFEFIGFNPSPATSLPPPSPPPPSPLCLRHISVRNMTVQKCHVLSSGEGLTGLLGLC